MVLAWLNMLTLAARNYFKRRGIICQKHFSVNAEILHNTPYEAISVLVDKTTTGTVVENGRTVLKAGAILSGVGGSIFEDRH